MACFFRDSWENFHLGIGNVFSKFINVEISIVLFKVSTSSELMKIHYMRCYKLISSFVSDVSDDENAIKSGENGTLEFDLLSSVL
jgi:hypothetical protein